MTVLVKFSTLSVKFTANSLGLSSGRANAISNIAWRTLLGILSQTRPVCDLRFSRPASLLSKYSLAGLAFGTFSMIINQHL